MAITDAASFYAKVENPRHRLFFNKLMFNPPRPSATWISGANVGATPTTAAVPESTTVGVLGGGALANPLVAHRIVGVRGATQMPGRFLICDRLSHQGGLSGTVTTAQTTNLPTAALTRYTSGEGVIAGLEIYTQIGATATTVTASYTDDGGNSGQTTIAVTFGGTSHREVHRFIPLPLAAGDTGVRAVASVTVLATTGTAGNFGVTLVKPLLAFSVSAPGPFVWDAIEDGGGNAPEVLPNAALSMFVLGTQSNGFAGGLEFVGEILLAEDD